MAEPHLERHVFICTNRREAGNPKGSCAEIVARLWRAHRRRCLTSEEYDAQRRMAEELQRMLGGFIKYLRATGFKDRGSYRAKHPAPGPAPTPPAPNPVDPDPPKR